MEGYYVTMISIMSQLRMTINPDVNTMVIGRSYWRQLAILWEDSIDFDYYLEFKCIK
jgi:hypothetical protein